MNYFIYFTSKWVCVVIMWGLKSRITIEKSFSYADYSISYSYSNPKSPQYYRMSLRFIQFYFNQHSYDKLFFFLHTQVFYPLTLSYCYFILWRRSQTDAKHLVRPLRHLVATFTQSYLFALALLGIAGSVSQVRCRNYEALCHCAPLSTKVKKINETKHNVTFLCPQIQ